MIRGNPTQLIVALEARGLRLSLQEGRLRVDGEPDPEALEVLRQHARELAVELRYRPQEWKEGNGGLVLRAKATFPGEVVRELTYAQFHAEMRQAFRDRWPTLDQVERTREARAYMLQVAEETGHPWAHQLFLELRWWCELFEPVEPDSPAVVA